MKKNFMAIASLLIAAMLLVVSCAPEANVEGKVKDGLVEAVIGLGRSAKNITITDDYAGTAITYKYTLKAAWKPEDTGAPIYGEVATEKELFTTTSFSETVSKSLGMVTPGLWNIEVKGYCKVNDVEKLVLQGKASAYFNGTKDEQATVFVAPVSSAEKVNVEIILKMQDLGDGTKNQIRYSFTNLNNQYVEETGIISNPTDFVNDTTENAGKTNVKVYKVSNVEVNSGFNTVTFSLPGYEEGKGGITKTFLAIPGVNVKIEGSVTPAEFVVGNAIITVLDIEGGSIAIKNGETPVRQTTEDGASIYALTKGTSYTFTYSNSKIDKNSEPYKSAIAAAGAEGSIRTYTWFVGDTPITNIDGSEFTHNFSDYKPGYYNITCIETVSFSRDGQDYELQTSATLANVRVL